MLVSFGIYCLIALAHGVATFRNCPEEAQALQQVSADMPSACFIHFVLSIWRCMKSDQHLITGLIALQDIAWARAELTARKVIGPGPLPEISE